MALLGLSFKPYIPSIRPWTEPSISQCLFMWIGTPTFFFRSNLSTDDKAMLHNTSYNFIFGTFLALVLSPPLANFRFLFNSERGRNHYYVARCGGAPGYLVNDGCSRSNDKHCQTTHDGNSLLPTSCYQQPACY